MLLVLETLMLSSVLLDTSATSYGDPLLGTEDRFWELSQFI